MSDDSDESQPPRPRRKIKKIVLASSSSASESDDSGPATSTRKKRLRVLSDEESESSGSSVVVGSRRKRMLPKLRDSEGDSDTSGWATDHSDVPKEGSAANGPASQAPKQASGFASDSSEGNSDKCSICLMRFTDQQVGTPQNCEHLFCLDCITEWSKNVNTCPVDRMKFDLIVVRACAGGRVLCTQPVQVMERVPSMEMLVVEDPTTCEICGNANNEDTMLLCDGCDLGFHMDCLTPPLTQIPINQWLCPSCADRWEGFDVLQVTMAEMDELLDSDVSEGEGRTVARRSHRAPRPAAGPSSSRGAPAPSTSRAAAGRAPPVRRRVTAGTSRRKRRTRPRTLIIEYELEENGKYPVTRRVKRRVKKRRTKKRQPRTAARRTYVRQSVRAALASLRAERAEGPARAPAVPLSARRARAGIPALSLFGSERDLEYFTDEEEGAGGGGMAFAARSAPSVFAAHRQARRKMVSIPSPTPATSATDVLSTILESQTLLHSKRSVVSISANGDVDINFEGSSRKRTPERRQPEVAAGERENRVDVKRAGAEGSARQAPSYPGQARGGGGWGGGYRYPREHPPAGYGRGGHDNGYGGYQGRYQQNDSARRDADNEPFNAYDNRRPHQYPADEPPFERNRRADNGRGPHDNFNNRRHEDRRQSAGPGPGPTWRPYAPRNDHPTRHSFGGFENPLDMRVGHAPSDAVPAGMDKPPAHQFAPLPSPPAFPLEPLAGEGEEDERSDSSLVIDTEKYDPTEPTNDDEDSGDEPAPAPAPAAAPLPPPPAFPALEPPAPLAAVEHILAGFDRGAMAVSHAALDSAVRQALRDHGHPAPAPAPPPAEGSDGDSDGDCPNFSIYSATSVHIASNASASALAAAPAPGPTLALALPDAGFEDLVQGDGDASPVPATPPALAAEESLPTLMSSPPAPLPSPPPAPLLSPEPAPLISPPQPSDYEVSAKKKSEEYKEKVSKRCPITTNTRNPIKIKLNTPSLIKRQVSLYDEEDVEEEAEPEPGEPRAGDEPGKESADAIGHDEPPTAEDETGRRTPDLEEDATAAVAPTEEREPEGSERDDTPSLPDDDTAAKEDDADDKSEGECAEEEPPRSPRSPRLAADLEKMTESISETEDERSYTPCLDEHRERDERGIEGLDTEMISEDDGDGIFSEEERHSPTPPPVASAEPSEAAAPSPSPPPAPRVEEPKKKKKKDSKKENKERKGKSKKGDIGFKKSGKNVKERNYRERDKDDSDDKRESGESERARRKKEKRADLERYDVRTLVSEKRRRTKDAFGRDVSPRSPSPAAPPARSSPSPSARAARRTSSPSPRRARPTPSPRRRTPSPSPRRSRLSPSPRRSRLSPSPRRARLSPSPRRARLSPSPRRARLSPSPRRVRPSPSPTPPIVARRSASPRRRRRRSSSRGKRAAGRRRASASRARKRRRSASAPSPKPKAKKKKRARSETSGARLPRRKSPKRKRARRSPLARAAAAAAWSRPASPRTPPPAPPPPALEPRRLRKRRDRSKHRRLDATGPSKEVFTSGDNILVSVSFKEQEAAEVVESRRERRRERRRRRLRACGEELAAKPVAIIDLERSPFRELTPSPKNVIVLSDDERAPPPPASEPHGPKTPPDPAAAPPPAPAATAPAPAAPAPAPAAPADSPRGPNTPPEPPDSPDAYDPYEPTHSPSPPPGGSPPRVPITLEAAQKTNMSADEVLDRRPLSPIEKVMALLQSTRDVSPEPLPPAGEAQQEAAAAAAGLGAGALPGPPPPALAPATGLPAAPQAPRIVLPEPARAQQAPKLFLAKPSPIKSDPIKPMQQATKISRLPLPLPRRAVGGESPYSPGSSDFGDLFSPPGGGGGGGGGGAASGKRDGFDALFDKPPRGKKRSNAAKVPVKLNKKKGKTQVDVKIDDDNLKILDELPSSAVEMQVKSKFLKKLNRQERVVEEVKLVLKPHYNKKHVSKDEYKHILRRTVPKICHNKTGEINPTKIQALVEAYVKKFRKRRKLGVVQLA